MAMISPVASSVASSPSSSPSSRGRRAAVSAPNMDAWLREQLRAFRTPRLSDALRVARERDGVSKKRALAYIKDNFPAYGETGRPSFPWPPKKSRTYAVHFYGTVSIDLAFFGRRQNKLLRELDLPNKTENAPALIMVDMATRYMIAEPLGPRGKSTAGVLAGLRKAFDKYRQHYGTFPFTVCSDLEKAVFSKEVRTYLDECGTTLFGYQFSRTKSLFAENAIRLLRTSFRQLAIHHDSSSNNSSKKAISWTSMLQSVVDQYNERKIIHHGKRLSFAPRDVTRDTFAAYKREIRNKLPGYSLMNFAIHPALFDWKHRVGERVWLKQRAVKVPGLGSKWSETPFVPNATFTIRGRSVHLNVRQQLVKTYVLEGEPGTTASGIVTRQPVEACVAVPSPLLRPSSPAPPPPPSEAP